jgi:hypothetical protein
MHPDPELDATLLDYFGVAFGHAPLYGERAFDRLDHAGELDERAISVSLTILS